MTLPAVKFKNAPIPMEAECMYNFLFLNEWGWGHWIIEKHPKIEEALSIKKKGDRMKFLEKYLRSYTVTNAIMIDNNRKKYEERWRKIEKRYFQTVADILEIDWPEHRRTITAMISLDPICPRFLDDWSFFIYFNYRKKSHEFETIMHECCHFLYFEKWRQMYPKISKRKFDHPYIEWHLSEIVAPIVLNDPRIQKILNQEAVFYPQHEQLKIGNKSVPEYFTRLYNESRGEKNGFEIFLTKAYTAIKANEEIFKTL